MRLLQSFPAIRIIAPFILGVIAGAFLIETYPLTIEFLIAITITWALLLLVLVIIGLRAAQGVLFGLLMTGCGFLSGVLLLFAHADQLFPDHLSKQPTGPATYLMTIDGEPEVKPRSIKMEGWALDTEGKGHGRVMFYIEKDSSISHLGYGDKLLVRTQLNLVKPNGNPNEFNYARYLRFHHIHHQAYVNSDRWKVEAVDEGSIRRIFFDLRKNMMGVLRQAGLEGSEYAIASALVLGYVADLDQTLVQAYASSGAIHVLAVSGMHIAIVYLLINWLLIPLTLVKKGELFRAIIIVFLLWGYAALTGLSPSVCRAVTMFTFVAVAKVINRKVSIYNTLACSAFALVLYDPLIVMQVGFQLSYAAVFGIVVLRSWLLDLYTPDSKAMDWLWEVTCISVAAQLVTFPLGLLYFHQFPSLFFVSNLFVIPLSTAVLILGLGLYVAQIWGPLLAFVGFIVKFLIKLMNEVVMINDRIPHAVATEIDITVLETLLIYALVGCIVWMLIKKEPRMLVPVAAITLLLLVSQTVEYNHQQTQQKLTVYNIRSETAISLMDGKNLQFIASEALQSNEQALLFNVKHHWWAQGVTEQRSIVLDDSLLNRPFQWNENNIIIVGKSSSDHTLHVPDSIDIAIVHSLRWDNISEMAAQLPRSVVLSSALGFKTKEELMSHLPEGVKVWDVTTQGAYQL